MPSLATFLTVYRVGDIVDIKANASEQKGLVSCSQSGCMLDFALTCSPTNVRNTRPNPAPPEVPSSPGSSRCPPFLLAARPPC